METRLESVRWISDVLGGSWETETRQKDTVTLFSASQSTPNRGVFYSRVCILDVPGKFFAETLLVYPDIEGNFPVFGSEYIKTKRGYFGATDFHPVVPENNTIPEEFGSFPDRIVEKSPHYDLNTHFSPKLWHKKGVEDFYDEFSTVCGGRLYHYLDVLSSKGRSETPDKVKFSAFDRYMAVNDPARGILKAYFDSEFADDYIEGFLFPHGECCG